MGAPRAAVLAIAALAWVGCATAPAWLTPGPTPSSNADAPELFEQPAAALGAPEGLRAASGELRSVPLKWEPLLVGDVGGYAVERATSSDGPFERVAVLPGALATTYVDTNTAGSDAPVSAQGDGASGQPSLDGVTFHYRVRAFAPSGALAALASGVVSATTAPPPAAPDDLRAYSRQPRSVPLSWRESEDVNTVGYRLERSPTSRGPFELLADVEGRHTTTYVDRGLGDLRVFYYRVAARNSAGGLGDPSEPVRAVTKPDPLPPVNLRTVALRLGENQLAWDPNVEEDIVGYRLLRTRQDGDSAELVAMLGPDETGATDGEVASGELLSYTLVALDSDELESEPAEPIAVESESYGLTATVKVDGIHLEWRARSDEGYHGAQVTRLGLFQTRHLGFTERNGFVDADVQSGQTYRYVVAFERADGSPAPRSRPLEVSVP